MAFAVHWGVDVVGRVGHEQVALGVFPFDVDLSDVNGFQYTLGLALGQSEVPESHPLWPGNLVQGQLPATHQRLQLADDVLSP
jgi:hypothetical protein